MVGADGLARVDDILAGLDYIAGRAISHNEHAAVSFGLVSVVCLSLTGEFHSLALNSALKLVSSGDSFSQ